LLYAAEPEPEPTTRKNPTRTRQPPNPPPASEPPKKNPRKKPAKPKKIVKKQPEEVDEVRLFSLQEDQKTFVPSADFKTFFPLPKLDIEETPTASENFIRGRVYCLLLSRNSILTKGKESSSSMTFSEMR
jgi:hypothetical protein